MREFRPYGSVRGARSDDTAGEFAFVANRAWRAELLCHGLSEDVIRTSQTLAGYVKSTFVSIP